MNTSNILNGDWKKNFVTHIRRVTGCSHEAAFEIMSTVIDMRETWEQGAYARCTNAFKQKTEKPLGNNNNEKIKI